MKEKRRDEKLGNVQREPGREEMAGGECMAAAWWKSETHGCLER